MNEHILTPDEYVIFKNAMETEKIKCKSVDQLFDSKENIKLVPLCESINHKIKNAISKEDLIELLTEIKKRLVYIEDQEILNEYLEDQK